MLSPAGSAAVGRAAIGAGADAVYIGAERFGARSAAGNRMEEIAEPPMRMGSGPGCM